VFTADQVREVARVVRPPFTAVFLYGSHARGDAETNSDVDVLQVTPTHTAPYAVGRINVTCYTLDQLLRLARNGGLFARHLVEEALPLEDPQGVLENLKSVYVGPLTYDGIKKEVCGCAPLLDVTQPQFAENVEGLISIVSYLIRTYLYAMAFDHGARSFAMAHIFDVLGQHRSRITLSDVRTQRNFSAFAAARKLYEELTGATCLRTEGSVEAFIVNASSRDNLAMTLGLRLLARGRTFTYDALQELEF
jgi:predicted nucleotidyltransferase